MDQLDALLAAYKQATGHDFVATPAAPVRDLTTGASGSDVTSLQTFLIGQGYAISPGATGYFGINTRDALARYQKDHGIIPAAGYFGPLTRAQMKAANLPGVWW
jgi:peptidoglycan hydrolase-like protein with peptidoglycan-binding domain